MEDTRWPLARRISTASSMAPQVLPQPTSSNSPSSPPHTRGGGGGLSEVGRRGERPVLVEGGPREGLRGGGQTRIREHHHHHVEGFGDLARRDDRIEAVLDTGGGHDHLGRITVAAEAGRQKIAL